MATISQRRTIAAPVDTVWDTLAEFGSIADWAANVTHSEIVTEAVEGVGVTRRVQAGNQTLLERVVTWDPGDTLAYELIGLPGIVREAENRWTLKSIGGQCEVELTSTVWTGPRPPQAVVGAVICRFLGRVGATLLDGLKTRIEKGAV